MPYLEDSTTEQKSLRQSIVGVLQLPAAQQLDFWCNNVHVSGPGLNTVYWALMGHQLSIAVNPQLPPNLAQYSADLDTFFFQRGSYGQVSAPVGEKALIVHECIHAMIDIAHISAGYTGLVDASLSPPLLTRSRGEGAAYVTQAMFIINFMGSARTTMEPIQIIANQIATKIKDEPGAFVSIEDARRLDEAIMDDPHYHDTLSRNNVLVSNGINL